MSCPRWGGPRRPSPRARRSGNCSCSSLVRSFALRLHLGDQRVVDRLAGLIGLARADSLGIGGEVVTRGDRAELQTPVDLRADIDVGHREAIAANEYVVGEPAVDRVDRLVVAAPAERHLLPGIV